MAPRNKEDQSLWRQNLARSHLFRREHTALLAKPNWRRVKKTDPNTNEEYYKINKATLKASPSERTGMLAVPKKRVALKERPVPTVIEPATLNARCKENTKLLAISKLPKLIHQKYELKNLLGPQFVERMNKYIKEKEDNMWKPPPHEAWLGIVKSSGKRFKTEKQFDRYLQKLERFASPRREFSPEIPKRKKVPLNTLIDRINEMSVPPERYLIKPPPDPPTVRPEALEYEISDRVNEIAQPRKFYVPDPGPPRTEAGVSLAALKYKPTERYDALATPRDRRHAPEVDVRENPFEVSPLALKYTITPRMAKLAMPVQRN